MIAGRSNARDVTTGTVIIEKKPRRWIREKDPLQ